FDLSLHRDGLHHLHADFLEAGLLQQAWQSQPNVGIAASARHSRTVKFVIAPECAALGINEVSAEIYVLHSKDASRAKRPIDSSDGRARSFQVREEKACVDNVELRFPVKGANVPRLKIHVVHPLLNPFRPRNVELALIDTEPEGSPAGTDSSREFESCVPASTAHVKAAEPIAQSETVEQRR